VEPWWAVVDVYRGRVSYGDLDQSGENEDEVAVSVTCNNGGGIGSGNLGYSSLILAVRGNSLHLLGKITPRQPLNAATGPALLGSVELLPGKVIAQESWYGPGDSSCCPSGRTTTVWTYSKGRLRSGRTIVLIPPTRHQKVPVP
jgi:hypothetical protein